MVEKSLLGKRAKPEPSEDESIYEVKHGLRFVKAYTHEFTTFAKRRWVGKSLLEVFSAEFKAYSTSYYEEAIATGKILCNGKIVSATSYRIKEGDKIIHKTSREETPIVADLPEIVFEDSRVIAVNKPSSVPVHPCGNFKFNSLQYILQLCLKMEGLKTVHRLDRQTSGIVFFAKSDVESNNFREALLSDNVKKVYYAKVLGDFQLACKDGVATCDYSIYCDSHADAIMTCAPKDKIPLEHKSKAKDAQTQFKFVKFDGTHSVVKCYPKTGRTHQIRVHLQKLGYPIANDQVYGGTVKNDGVIELKPEWFENSYQNKEEGGKKEFLILWLHAYKYTYESLVVKTKVPLWAQ